MQGIGCSSGLDTFIVSSSKLDGGGSRETAAIKDVRAELEMKN